MRERKEPSELAAVNIDYDTVKERERFLKDVWSIQSDFWAFVEDWKTYYLTTSTLLEMISVPNDAYIQLVSLGSGPGLYETFLAKFFDSHGIGSLTTCVDFASGMTDVQNFILTRQNPRLTNIVAVTAAMS